MGAVWRRLLLSILVTAGLGAIVFGFSIGVTGEDTTASLPVAIESLSPQRNAQVQRQSEIIVDLAPGYDGALVINGVAIPPDQLSFDLGLFQLVFPCRLADSSAAPASPTGTAAPNAPQVRTPQPPCSRNLEGAELISMPKGAVTATVEYWPIATGRETHNFYTWTFSTI
jgi:hypothetical protein